MKPINGKQQQKQSQEEQQLDSILKLSNLDENNISLKRPLSPTSSLSSTSSSHLDSQSCQLTPNSAANDSSGKPVERKRTANLENLIGNLKVRKLNQAPSHNHHHHHHHHQSNKKNVNTDNSDKMTSLYVEVTNSVSDCSRSTPPLSSSSPSVSPSSLSIAPDSPPQSHTSSLSSLSASSLTNPVNTASSSCSSINKSHYSMLPKFRWMMESSSPPPAMQQMQENDENEHEQSQNEDNKLKSNDNGASDEEINNNNDSAQNYIKQEDYDDKEAQSYDSDIKQKWNVNQINTDNNDEEEDEEEDDDETEESKNIEQYKIQYQQKILQQQLQLQQAAAAAAAVVQQNNKKQKPKQQNNHASSDISRSPSSTGSKNQEDPSRTVKFYEDHIDFRGDILRRPPNSKNCRILWEYLYLLLQDNNYNSVIKWEDDVNMVFRIVQAEKLAALWGLQKNRLGMTYEKLSRGMRYYYPNNIIAREPGRRLLYRFMRHPDEIKKFVKKNGTYMLKKTKQGGKNTSADLDESIRTELNPDDSGVDEPSNGSKKNQQSNIGNSTGATKGRKPGKSSKKQSVKNEKNNIEEYMDDVSEENDYEVHEEIDEEINEDDDRESTSNQKMNEDEKHKHAHSSSPTSSITSSTPSSSSMSPTYTFSNNLNNNNNNNNNNKLNNNKNGDMLASQKPLNTTLTNPLNTSNLANPMSHFYPDFYNSYMYSAQMAAYFSRIMSSTDDVNAAQFLMQLHNQKANQACMDAASAAVNNLASFDNNLILNESLQNLATSLFNRSAGLPAASSSSSSSSSSTSSSISEQINKNINNKKVSNRSNGASSASSTYSSSSSYSIKNESIDVNSLKNHNDEDNDNYTKKIQNNYINNNNNNYHQSSENHYSNDYKNSLDHPLNLSMKTNNNSSNNNTNVVNNNNNKKRKSKYDTSRFQ